MIQQPQPSMPFHQALVRHRTTRGLTRRDVATRIGVPVRLVEDWEEGLAIPTPDRFSRLTKMLFMELKIYRQEFEIAWTRERDRAQQLREATLKTPAGQKVKAALEAAAAAAAAAALPAPTLPGEEGVSVAQPQLADTSTFGNSLRSLREHYKLTMQDLSELLDVSDMAVYWWEIGRCAPVIENYQKLLDLFPELADCPRPESRNIPIPCGRSPGDGQNLDTQSWADASVEASPPPSLRLIPRATEPAATAVPEAAEAPVEAIHVEPEPMTKPDAGAMLFAAMRAHKLIELRINKLTVELATARDQLIQAEEALRAAQEAAMKAAAEEAAQALGVPV